jgi:uncharacterized protein
MFFGVGFLIFLVLTGYAYFRIRSLLELRRQKIFFSIAYWLLALFFPLVEILSHSAAPAWADRFLVPGYLSLPYLLYLFLLVIAFDLLRVGNHILSLFPRESLKTKNARLTSVILLLTVPGIVVLAGNIRNTELRVNEYQIEIPRKGSDARQWSIAVASDFHLGSITDPATMPRFAEKINSLNADILLLPGDLLEGDRQEIRVEEFARAFRSIRTRYGVFGSLGNHESYGRGNKLAFFERSGITVLKDSAVLVDRALWLIGRNDSRSVGRKSFRDLMQCVMDSLPVVVLDHKPTDLENIRISGADIVVCGHTHNGQLWPLNYITRSIYHISWGYEKVGSLHVFVTSGVQVWGPPVRTAGDSEIMLVHIAVR